MASSSSPPIFSILLLVLVLLCTRVSGCFTGIFAFGDTYTDAGNYAIMYNAFDKVGPPYGITYFRRPTGRFSDGRVIPDFLAQAFGLPFPPPSAEVPSRHDRRQGMSFSVGGATALKYGYFLDRGVKQWVNTSLGLQIDSFKEQLPSICSSYMECSEVLGSALFLVGQIGVIDFDKPFLDGKSLSELETYIPDIVQAITLAIEELIKLGARTLVVPGFYANGCLPLFLVQYYNKGAGKDEYDDAGCIKGVNQFTESYNLYLQESLQCLRGRYPYADIVYANLYEPTMRIISSPQQYGFNKESLRVCCGSGGGAYNFEGVSCGSPGVTACVDPRRAVFWTQYYFTEAAYGVMAESILHELFAVSSIGDACPMIPSFLVESLDAYY